MKRNLKTIFKENYTTIIAILLNLIVALMCEVAGIECLNNGQVILGYLNIFLAGVNLGCGGVNVVRIIRNSRDRE